MVTPMTRGMMKVFPWLAALLVGAAFAAGGRGPETVDVSAYPAEQQKNYQTFQVRCSKCHTLARPLNSRLRGEGWRAYIRKMMRKAGSGIDDGDSKAIFSFLEYYYQRRDGVTVDQPLPKEAAPQP
jgi:hypothetical protein